MTRPVLYISGPFSDSDFIHGIERNILAASTAALEAWQKGWAALCPHKNCAGFQHVGDYEADFWIEGDLVLLNRLRRQQGDAILMLPGWDRSLGAQQEYRAAMLQGLEVHFYAGPGTVPWVVGRS